MLLFILFLLFTHLSRFLSLFDYHFVLFYFILFLLKSKLVGEYIRDDNVDPLEIRDVYSATKTITGLLFGILVDKYQVSLETTLEEFFKHHDDAFDLVDEKNLQKLKETTLYQLLTMTSGFSDMGFPEQGVLYGGGDLQSTLAWQMDEAIRDKWSYTQIWNILGYIVLDVTGLNVFELLSRDVLPSLGINSDEIVWSSISPHSDPPLVYPHPPPLTNLYLNANQAAKFTQLLLQLGNDGQGRQVVSSNYMQDMRSPLASVPKSWTVSEGKNFSYGYMMFNAPPNISGKNNIQLYLAWGMKGQRFLWCPSLDMVTIIFSDGDAEDFDDDDWVYYYALFDGTYDFGSRSNTISYSFT